MVTWRWLDFNEISVRELYDLLALRQQVFVVEQDCVYLDVDGKDPECRHVIGMIESNDQQGPASKISAYARILPRGLSYDTVSIGRVIVTEAGRGTGLGKALIVECLQEVERLYPGEPITIGAQHHLERFYNGFGFTSIGEPYLDDGILHVDMIRNPSHLAPSN
jgi:ElaA protein